MTRTALMLAALLLPMAPCVSAQSVSGDPPAAMTLWLEGNGLKLKTRVCESAKLSSHPVLIVVLHGDLLGVWNVPPSTYHYVFADEAARRVEDVVVAAVLGAKDDVAPASMSTGYAEALKKRVNNVTLTIALEAGRELLLEPVTYESVSTGRLSPAAWCSSSERW
jgi:hypothetical protein